ncbi:MAG TPA: glycine betaine ABC transporter substrate-binding protein [Oculatellaceae cyanobacterium]
MTGETWLDFLIERGPELYQRLTEHMMLTTVSTGVAAVMGIFIAVFAFQQKVWRDPIMSVVGILQTIPSLALLVFLMTIIGKIGILPALCALILYALLPIVRNTLLGLESTPAAAVEAAEGIGMTGFQQITMVRLPIAIPAIVSGVRTATVVGVGIATLSAFIGAGGLGEFINRGLALSNSQLILLGAIPSGFLAIVYDFCLASAEWGIRPVRNTDVPLAVKRQMFRRRAAVSVPIVIFLLGIILYFQAHPAFSGKPHVRIGSKHYTEQVLLAELMAQTLEKAAGVDVDRKFDLGGTMVCHGAVVAGEIDLYPEYTGTALTSVLKIKNTPGQKDILARVAADYDSKFKIKWLSPFGFSNQWALLANQADAQKNHWSTISDLRVRAPQLHIGMPAEFAEREDGFKGLIKNYGIKFGKVDDLDTNLAYKALLERQLDLAAGNSTDGRIDAYKLVVLDDDLHYFPPYEAAPIVREEILNQYPAIGPALQRLGGTIDNQTMQKLNYRVDGEHLSPARVVKDFLIQHPQILAHTLDLKEKCPTIR